MAGWELCTGSLAWEWPGASVLDDTRCLVAPATEAEQSINLPEAPNSETDKAVVNSMGALGP